MQNRAAHRLPPLLNFYPQFWTKAFDFRGRIRRVDYWKIHVVNFILAILISRLAPTSLYYIFIVASICPGIAMNIRRIRDTGKHWQWIFIALIPIVGLFWMIWIQCQPSIESD